MNQITYIPLDDIVFDSQQPRKFFDEAAHQELVQSVKEMGVLQPIVVQPGVMIGTGHKKPQRPGYMIICGERRYRAAWEAELEEIPAVIREGLSPEEVLEIQITENLQRKDVNPMEEGIAFAKLYSRYSIEEIAKRVGKSEKYVAQRISLSDLIEPWQQLVYNGSITLTDAYKLARQGKEAQQEIYKACREDWDADDEEPIKSWVLERALEDHDCDLTRAKFDTEDEELYPEAGACTGCRYNSANQPLLFADLGSNKICNNSPCFVIKETRSYMKNLKEVIADPNVVLLYNGYGHFDNKEKARIAEVEAMGCTVLNREQFKVLDEPTAPEPWEEFLAECKEDFEYDEMKPAMQKERLADWKRDYAELMQEYEMEMKQYQEEASRARDGFIVAGYDEGKRVKVVLTGKASKAGRVAGPHASPEEQELANLESEMAGIEAREDRAKELDCEKVMKVIVDILKNDQGTFLTTTANLDDELEALIVAMASIDYSIRDFLESATGKSYDYSLNGMHSHLEKLHRSELDVLFAQVARRFMLKFLVSAQEYNIDRHGKAQALYELAHIHFPNTVETIEMEQKQKADKRASNVEKRLAILREKREQLAAKIQENKTRAANEAAGKKAQNAAKSKTSKAKAK